MTFQKGHKAFEGTENTRFKKGTIPKNKMFLPSYEIVNLYVQEQKTVKDISKMFKCSHIPIRMILLEEKIEA